MAEASEPSKRALRAEIRERRRIMTGPERASAAAGLLKNLQELVSSRGATSISCYLSVNDEPPTRDFIDWALHHGIRVLLPVAREDGLMDWAPYEAGDEAIDASGMPMPTTANLGPIAISEVDVILIPAASIGTDGMRLGWGRGYFDRTLGSLTKRPPVYAVIYDHEVVESVPRENHDQAVDGVVTPERIIRVAG